MQFHVGVALKRPLVMAWMRPGSIILALSVVALSRDTRTCCKCLLHFRGCYFPEIYWGFIVLFYIKVQAGGGIRARPEPS